MTVPKTTRAGFVAVIGLPNAGKSTLLNQLVGRKVSITSPKPQTTRMRVVGVCTSPPVQIAFVDTPGIFMPKRRLDRAMVKAAWQALDDADAVVLLVDAGARNRDALDAVIEELRQRKQQVIVALNKIDVLPKDKLLPLAEDLFGTGVAEKIYMISAKTGDGLDDLKKDLFKRMPAGPWFYAPEQATDLSPSLLAAECTREQLYRQLQQELPYAATVVPGSYETKKDGSIVIHQTIMVERPAHRPIVLGARGARIKAIGEASRKNLTQMLATPVHLFLEVQSDEKWQDRPEFYRVFGLEFVKK